MPKSNRTIATSLSALLLVGGIACDGGGSNADMPIYLDGGITLNTTVEGYSWDPEAFWLTLATCAGTNPPPGTCQLPPVIAPGFPIFEIAKLPGIQVGLFDPLQPMQTMPLPYMAPSLTSSNEAGYIIENVPSRPGPPFFAVGFKPPSMTDGGAPMFPPFIPAAELLPTFTLKPIGTGQYTLCLGQEATMLSDGGILEAVAKTMNLPAAGALLDPSVTGGVLVSWLYLPQSPPVRVPAFGAFTQATIGADPAGTAYDIWWAPPGALPPQLKQSRRGFFVNQSGPPMPNQQGPIGLTVIVLPPLMGPPPSITLAFKDPVTDAPSGRPWSWPSLPPVQIPPGLVTYLGLVGNIAKPAGIPGYACVPQ